MGRKTRALWNWKWWLLRDKVQKKCRVCAKMMDEVQGTRWRYYCSRACRHLRHNLKPQKFGRRVYVKTVRTIKGVAIKLGAFRKPKRRIEYVQSAEGSAGVAVGVHEGQRGAIA